MKSDFLVILLGILVAYLSESFAPDTVKRLLSALGVILVIVGVVDLLSVIFGSGHIVNLPA